MTAINANITDDLSHNIVYKLDNIAITDMKLLNMPKAEGTDNTNINVADNINTNDGAKVNPLNKAEEPPQNDMALLNILKAIYVANANYEGLDIQFNGPSLPLAEGLESFPYNGSLHIANISLKNLGLYGPLLKKTPSRFTIGNPKVSDLLISDLTLKASYGENFYDINLKEIHGADMEDFTKIGSFALTDFALIYKNLNGTGNFSDLGLNLAKLSAKGLDFTQMYSSLGSLDYHAIGTAATDEEVNQILPLSLSNFSMLFTQPYSLDNIFLDNMTFNLGKGINIELANAGLEGPLIIGKIASFRANITDLVFNIAPSITPQDPTTDFFNILGHNTLTVNIENSTHYDPNTKVYTFKVDKFDISHLASFNWELSLDNITQKVVTDLSQIHSTKILDFEKYLLNSNVGIKSMSFDYVDHSLIDNLIEIAVKDEDDDIESFKNTQIEKLNQYLTRMLQGSLSNDKILSITTSMGNFINAPENLRITIDPVATINFKNFSTHFTSLDDILTFLNINLSTNDSEPINIAP
jgi:hypothetical protein